MINSRCSVFPLKPSTVYALYVQHVCGRDVQTKLDVHTSDLSYTHWRHRSREQWTLWVRSSVLNINENDDNYRTRTEIPATSRQPACLHRWNREVGDVRDKTRWHGEVCDRRRRRQINGDVTGLSRTSRGCRHSGIWAWLIYRPIIWNGMNIVWYNII